MILRTLVCLAILFAVSGTSVSAEELPSAFNGKDFTGWQVPAENPWWTIENQELRVQSDSAKQGSTLWTEQKFKNFVMELEFKFGSGTVDSGVFVRAEREQIQIGISGSLKRDMTASPYIAGKGYPVEAAGVADLLKLDDWNSMIIVAVGPTYTVWLNGEQVMSYKSDSAVAEGPVGLQLHPNTEMSISFRNIRIAELD